MGGHNDSHGHGGASHGTKKEYITGLMLSILFTVIPFFLVMNPCLASTGVIMATIMLCAVAQLIVQSVFFLHLNTSSEQSWNLFTGAYTVLIFIVLIVGSAWIFTHVHHNVLMGH